MSSLKYVFIFSLGVGCGVWSTVKRLPNKPSGPLSQTTRWSPQEALSQPTDLVKYDEMGERCVAAGKNAYSLVRLLTHMHYGQDDRAKREAEELLDKETLKAYEAAALSTNLDAIDQCGIHLLIVKRYRQRHPSTSRYKTALRRVFTDLPADAFMDTDKAARFDPLNHGVLKGYPPAATPRSKTQ